MKILKKELLNSKFSHIYVEKAAFKNKNTLNILSKFPRARIIEIDNYKEIFSSNSQNFNLQKLSHKLILAVKNENNIYKGAKVCESFGNENFYYTSSIINCIFDCEYCYLQGVYPSANIVVFVNIEDVFQEVESLLKKLDTLYLCISYDTDLLALDDICDFVNKWYTLVENNPNLKIELRTKSVNIRKLLEKKANENFIVAFTLSPERITKDYEKNTSSLERRLEAIKKLQENNWKVRLCIDPIIYEKDFEKIYSEMIAKVFQNLDKNKIIDISIGFFRISKEYLKKMRKQNPDSKVLYYPYECVEGVYSYSKEKRERALKFVKELLLCHIEENKIFV